MAKLQLTTLIPINSKDFNQFYSSIMGQTFASSITNLTNKKVKYVEKMKRINLRTAIFQNSIQQWKQTIGRLTSLITNDSPERLNEIAKQKKSAHF